MEVGGGRRVNTCSTDAPWRDGEMERKRCDPRLLIGYLPAWTCLLSTGDNQICSSQLLLLLCCTQRRLHTHSVITAIKVCLSHRDMLLLSSDFISTNFLENSLFLCHLLP